MTDDERELLLAVAEWVARQERPIQTKEGLQVLRALACIRAIDLNHARAQPELIDASEQAEC